MLAQNQPELRNPANASQRIAEYPWNCDFYGSLGPPPDGDALHAIMDAVASRSCQNHSSCTTRASEIQRRKRLGGRAAVEVAIVTFDHLCARSANLRDG